MHIHTYISTSIRGLGLFEIEPLLPDLHIKSLQIISSAPLCVFLQYSYILSSVLRSLVNKTSTENVTVSPTLFQKICTNTTEITTDVNFTDQQSLSSMENGKDEMEVWRRKTKHERAGVLCPGLSFWLQRVCFMWNGRMDPLIISEHSRTAFFMLVDILIWEEIMKAITSSPRLSHWAHSLFVTCLHLALKTLQASVWIFVQSQLPLLSLPWKKTLCPMC